MKKEKIILSVAAIFIALVLVVGGFYIYQSTKTISDEKLKPLVKTRITPTPIPNIFLAIESPKNEEVFNKRTITVSGKTAPDAKILIYTPTVEESATPSKNGSFSTTITIDSGQNLIKITAIAPDGEEETVERVVSYTTEDF